MSGTVALEHHPWGEDYGVGAAPPRGPRRAYLRALAHKANPRSRSYMEELLRARWPDASLVRTDDPGWRRAVAVGDRVVLLYPDSTGLGFSPLEREAARLASATLAALNGRGRVFALDRRTRRGLRMRRLLERSMVVEGAALALLALLTPALVAADLLRGRR